MNLVLSAVQEQPHTRAWRLGLEKYGDTPIYMALVAEFAAPKTRRDERGRFTR